MSNGKENFQKVQGSYRGSVNLADRKTSVPARGKDHVHIVANVEGRTKKFRIENALCVSELRTTCSL